MTDEVVTRLYRALVEELQGRGHDPDRPVKVSELYQDLVPYKAVRSALGVELNADYEHALLRLLSGERNLLRLEPAQAREELRREVEAPYPFVGLFRKFSASNVWIEMPEQKPEPAPEPEETAVEPAAAAPAGAADRTAPASPPAAPPAGPAAGRTPRDGAAEEAAADTAASGPRPSESGPRAQPREEPRRRLAAERNAGPVAGGGPAAERVPVQLHAEEAAPVRRLDPTERMSHAGQACAFCEETLPEGRRVRFCPHCGGDQRLRPCARCDAVLERGWQYCISCGHEASVR